MKAVSLAAVENVLIDQIVVGERRRERPGRIKQLAASIYARGLIHPILLRGDVLVAGYRRLEACRSLHWKTIPARRVERLTDDELRAIELEENTHRENLSDFAMSKARLAQIRQAEADLKVTAREPEKRLPSKRNQRGAGRRKRAGSRRDIASATDISPASQVKTEHHVALAEAYPFMQRSGWLQHHVLEAGPILEQFTDRDKPVIAALLDQDCIPPKKAIHMLQNLAGMSAGDRAAIARLAQSDDPEDRTVALTKAAAVPPPVDPGLLLLGDAEEKLAKAAAACRSQNFRPRVAALAADATQLLSAFREANDDERRRPIPA